MGIDYGYGDRPRRSIASQYALTESRLKKMLEDAFIAGYESPIEFMEQEVGRILREPVEEAQKKAKELAPEPSAKKKIKGGARFLDTNKAMREIESSYRNPYADLPEVNLAVESQKIVAKPCMLKGEWKFLGGGITVD